ncbi:unnamed protein product [Closterium sp. Yama58-4]|nr:unnamed protein product [Closterium sp. Yama58-4]
MLVQRDPVSGAASALTTLSTEQDRRKRKVKHELPRPRAVTSAGSGVRGAGEVPPPPSDDVIARLMRPNYQRDFQPLALYGPHGVGCQLPAQDVLTLADGQCLADTVVDFHNILLNIRYPTLEGGKTWFALDTKPEDIPQQTNAVDCGIYVGMYLHALVTSGFAHLKEWMTFFGAKSHAYRRQLREEVSLHATGDLVVKLLGEGVHVPVQPLPQVGEHGALVFPKEDEVRTDLARQSGVLTRLELGGFVVSAAVIGLARSLGIWGEQLLSGAAHELQIHGTPLLSLYTSKNPVEHSASMRTLGQSIHPDPCPLPLPSVPSAHFEEASPINGEPTPGQQIRLGAYTVELDAAYAYAAAAFVIRRNDHIPHVQELTDEQKACLEGCVRDDVRHLVKARMWWRWRQWRTALAELGIEPGTPFPLENNATRSPDNSSSDENVQDMMGHVGETVCE